MKCLKCGIIIEPEEFTDLHRIEGHHLHPSFMDNPSGSGTIINLCRDCHKKETKNNNLKEERKGDTKTTPD